MVTKYMNNGLKIRILPWAFCVTSLKLVPDIWPHLTPLCLFRVCIILMRQRSYFRGAFNSFFSLSLQAVEASAPKVSGSVAFSASKRKVDSSEDSSPPPKRWRQFLCHSECIICLHEHTHIHTRTHMRAHTRSRKHTHTHTHTHCTSCILSHRVFNNLHTTCFKDRKLIIKKWIDCLLRVPFINFR